MQATSEPGCLAFGHCTARVRLVLRCPVKHARYVERGGRACVHVCRCRFALAPAHALACMPGSAVH